GRRGVRRSRPIWKTGPAPAVMGDVRAAAGCGWRSRTGALPAGKSQQNGWATAIRLLVVAISASGASVQPVLAGHAVAWTGSATGEASQSGLGQRTTVR